MKRLEDGSYLNFNLIIEIGVVPSHIKGEDYYLIKYWYPNGDEFEIPGFYNTEEEAQNALDKLMKGNENERK